MRGDSSWREQAQAVLFSLIMLVSMIGIGAAGFAGSAAAQASDTVENVDTGETFDTIQAAIDAGNTNDGDVIEVSQKTGNYSLSGTGEAGLNINKELTIQAADGENPIIIDNVGDSDQEGIGIQADNITVSGFTLDSEDDGDSTIVVNGNNTTIADNTFTFDSGSINDIGIETVPNSLPPEGKFNGVSGLTVHNNVFNHPDDSSSNTYYGVYISPSDDDGEDLNTEQVSVTDNTFNGAVLQGIVSEHDNVVISDNTLNASVSVSSNNGIIVRQAATADDQVSDVTIESNTIGGSAGFNSAIEAGTFDGDPVNNLTVSSNDITNASDEGILIEGDVDKVDIKHNTLTSISDQGDGAIVLNPNNGPFTLVNVTGNTIQDSSGATGLNILQASDKNVDLDVDGLSIDNVSTGIDISESREIDIDNVDINATTVGIDYNDDGASTTNNLNITNSAITNADTAGVQFNGDGDGSNLNVRVHFNTFSNNEVGIETATDFNSGVSVDLTFNDFTENNANGYEDSQGQSNIEVNAEYSYWGSDAGPDSDLGDSVSAAASDVTLKPFLVASAVDNYDDSNLGGTNVLRFGHSVEVTNNKGSLAFPAVANRTAGASIEGNTTNVMIYKLVDGAFVDAGDQVPQTMEGHVVDLTESTRDSAFVTITYSDDVADSAGGYTYEQGANLVGAPKQGDAGLDAVFNLKEDYVISPYLDNTGNFYPGGYARTTSISDDSDGGKLIGEAVDEVSPFSAYVIEVPDNETRFKGGYIPGGTEASEIDGLLSNGGA